MTTMVSLKRHRYGGATREIGDTFAVRSGDVKTLKALGRARVVEEPKAEGTYARRDMRAEGTTTGKRTRRRDQTAAK